MTPVVLRRSDAIITTGNRWDWVFAGAGNDSIFTGAGRDFVFAGPGDDTIDGGAGGDLVHAGTGDDTVVHRTTGNGRECDRYFGGQGKDTLRLDLTAEDWARAEVQAETRAFQGLIDAANGAPVSFTFYTLKLKSFEALELTIDGQPFDPRVQVVDLSGSTADETVTITSAVGSNVTTGSGNDTIIGGPGDDTISSGAGNDLIELGAGDDIVLAGSGNDTIIAAPASMRSFCPATSRNIPSRGTSTTLASISSRILAAAATAWI